MKTIILLIIISSIASCSFAKLETKRVDRACESIRQVFKIENIILNEENTFMKDTITALQNGDIIADSLLKNVVLNKIILINKSKNKLINFTIKKSTTLEKEVTSSTFIISLQPGMEVILGCNYFPYELLSKKNKNELTYNVEIKLGQNKFIIVGEQIIN